MISQIVVKSKLVNKESDGKLLIDLVDWSKASTAWSGYNPSKNNYQKKGILKDIFLEALI